MLWVIGYSSALIEASIMQAKKGPCGKLLMDATDLPKSARDLNLRRAQAQLDMLQRISRRPWTCRTCLLRLQKRRHSSINAAPKSQLPASHVNPGATHEDLTLRQVFDDREFWRQFSESAKHGFPGESVGLFRNRHLTRPEGFQEFANSTLQKCHRTVATVLAARTPQEYKSIARDLDRLSDLLCRVIDLSDFVRSTHPDKKIQAAATQAYSMMFEYMNQLNTTTGLDAQLKKAMSIPEVFNSWTEEEQTVARILEKDFSKSAIDLPDNVRQRFVELSSDISEIGTDFINTMAPQTEFLEFESSRLKGIDPRVARQLTRWGKVTLPTVGPYSSLALRQVEDSDVRRELYMASRTASKESIRKLERLLKTRAELANIAGYKSFAHMTLSDKMAQSPEAVHKFLTALAAQNAPRVREELQELLELKSSDAHARSLFSANINAWDREYHTSRILASLRTRIRYPDSLSSYFSLGTVMQGLSRLFSSLYGVRLVPRETLPGEAWNKDVRRLDVIDETEGHIAVVYCDLFSRMGKNPNPAHFTLRCSRQITPFEVQEADSAYHPFDSPIEAATDGLSYSRSVHDGSIYQLPTIALICDFAEPQDGKKPTLLTFREVQTLFHEMGHAIHSILGRTKLQNVSGTRCATDFAELPSVLMEHFASAPEVLGQFARHWETGAPLDYSLVRERLSIDERLQASENESQIILALLDQAYHSELPLGASPFENEGWSSTRTYHDIYSQYSSIPEPAGTAWQGFFGHLFGYGATYYSYLFDRAIAGKVWKDVFQRNGAGGAIDRANGELFRNEVLRWGGSRDGWKCVAGALKDPSLADGGEMAMLEVGRWGVAG